jgi:uncharacterized membrane protein
MTLPRRKIQFLLMAVVLGVLFVSSRPTYADTYNFTVINYPGSFHVVVSGINNNGDIFGTVGEPFDTGFLYQNGNYSLFPGIVDVNNNGMILFNSPSGPAIFFNGQATPLNVPGSVIAFNDNGTVLVTGGFVKNGIFTPVNYPGAVSTTVSGINDLDEVVGSYRSGNFPHGFLYKDGVYTTIDVGSIYSNAIAINNNGEIVGNYSSPSYPVIHGFTYENGNYQSFDAFNSFFAGFVTVPTGINDFGEITGIAARFSEPSFVATPVPEPGTVGLVGLGMMVIAGAVRRRMC